MAGPEARGGRDGRAAGDDWPRVPPPAGPGSGGFGGGPEQLSDLLARRLFEQRVVLLTGALDEVRVTRVSAELMTLDADGDDPVTLRVDCGEANLAPALTLMDVIELMGVPVRALCLGRVGGGAVGVVAVCSHRTALPSTRFSLCEPTTQFEAHVRNVAQWAELRAGERRRFCARGRGRGSAERDDRGGSRTGPFPQRRGGHGLRDPRRRVRLRRGHPESPRRRRWREGLRAAAHGVSSAALIRGHLAPTCADLRRPAPTCADRTVPEAATVPTMRQWHHLRRRPMPPLEDRPAARGCHRSQRGSGTGS